MSTPTSQGFINVLEGCRHNGCRHLLYASSSSVYGANTRLPFSTADNVDHPISLYAASKKANELMAHSYAHLFRLPATGLRFFTVYGPWGRPDMAMWIFAKAIMEGQPIRLFNHGKMRRDFTYVDDVVESVVRLIDKPAAADPSWSGDNPDPSRSAAPWRIYNIGNNQPVDVPHVVDLLEKALGRTAPREMLPMQPGDVPATYADVDDLMRDVGFRPSTPIADGVARFVAWYRDYHKRLKEKRPGTVECAGRGGRCRTADSGRPVAVYILVMSRSLVSGRKISATTKLIAATMIGYQRPE